MGKRGRKAGARYNAVENMQARAIDNVRQFEEFKSDILPKIRKMLKDGKKAEEIIAFAQSFAAARMVTIALTDESSSEASKAIKDILDRGIGKPKESREITHRLEKMKDEELDALLASKLAEANDADEDTTEH